MQKSYFLIFSLILISLLISCSKTSAPPSYEREKKSEYYVEEALSVSPSPAMSKSLSMTQDSMAFKSGEVSNTAKPDNFNTEEYTKINENTFKDTKENPESTFSIDVDTASYSNMRRFITSGQLPPPDSVRIEEMINYFKYDYPDASANESFSVTAEYAVSPWNEKNNIVLIGIQGKKLNYSELKPCNFVFLVDCSGSMSDENKLPLLKKSLALMLKGLSKKDRIAIVAYAGAAGLILPSTEAVEGEKILAALDSLNSGGSTAGGAGIELAYKIARENLIPDGNNRVILCTDGDFNIGVSDSGSLVRMIEEKRKENIYITICGFGMGNVKDSRMEQIANAGNGNYFYIDGIQEANKVFVKEMRANMFTIAKDVKIQIEFNPLYVKSYRLIGYENRLLANEDFENDAKDAGELGAGHTVTAMYEIVSADTQASKNTTASNLKYQTSDLTQAAKESKEILTLRLRYKNPKSDTSILIEKPLKYDLKALKDASMNLRFASAVAAYGLLLRDSAFKGNLSYDFVIKLAEGAKGQDEEGYRTAFIELVKQAKELKR